MYVCQLTISCQQDLEISDAQSAITELLEQYRYNGQIIGREFPIIFNGELFEVIFVCPEQSSLSPEHNNQQVNIAFENLAKQGLSFPEFAVKGLESQSDFTDVCDKTSALILYSTFVQSCSPVRCFEHFAPIPLYRLPGNVRKPLVKWQETYGACDQLQMNELANIEPEVIEQLSNINSELMTEAETLAQEISAERNIPVYRYLYRVGGESLEAEQQRLCPSCQQPWRQTLAIHGLFDFKCDECRLVSNISWDWQ